MQKFSLKIIFIIIILVVSTLIVFYLNNHINENENEIVVLDTTYLQNDINKFLIDKSGTLEITYVLPDNIYLTIDELYTDFFTELFYYAYNYNETSAAYLAKYGIKSLGDTLRICRTWTGGARGFPTVGLAFGPYFLKPRSHGNFNDARRTNTFVGYCLNNDKFVDILYYLKNFFYHWRIDEGYRLSFDEYGYSPATDFFLYPDISLVDTAKFFYYYSHSLPLNIYYKDNIPKLYNEIPGLLKKPFSKKAKYHYSIGEESTFTFPSDFDCYGFKFKGWYNNENFSGEPLTQIDKFTAIECNSPITLYAKFERHGKYSTEIKKDKRSYSK